MGMTTKSLDLQALHEVANSLPSSIAVSVRGLSKQFPRRRTWAETLRAPWGGDWITAVSNVTFDLRPGEFFGLLGPNGAGKSTLFRVLSTLLRPESGTAVVGGYDLRLEPARVREAVAPAFTDDRSLFLRLSARENLNLYAALRGFRGAEARRRVAEALDAVALADTGEKMVGQFSSGMKQRILIARALLATPNLLLLDEPTRSLDPVSAREFRSLLKNRIAPSIGCTVILATHSSEEAFDLCDRVGVIHQGRLLATGRATDLAREFHNHRYRLVVGDISAAVIRRHFDGLGIRLVGDGTPDDDGWTAYECEIPGGTDVAATLVTTLVADGIAVARCERIELPLASLIESIVERAGQPT
jgi:ABC-type multidrug transport system ATPase subunit